MVRDRACSAQIATHEMQYDLVLDHGEVVRHEIQCTRYGTIGLRIVSSTKLGVSEEDQQIGALRV